MIVQRFTFQMKKGKWEETVKMAKEGRKTIWPFITCRIYTNNYGPMNTLVFENEFKDMAELDKQWEQLEAKEEWAVWLAKLDELTTEEGKSELWNLE